MAQGKQYSEPVRILHEFIKTTDMEQEFDFICSEANVTRYLHRMRVELSRMREFVRAQGKKPKEFKLIHVKTVVQDNKIAHVTIKKSLSRSPVMNMLSPLVLDALTDDAA